MLRKQHETMDLLSRGSVWLWGPAARYRGLQVSFVAASKAEAKSAQE